MTSQEEAVDLLSIGISIKLDKPLYLIDMYANLQEIYVAWLSSSKSI